MTQDGLTDAEHRAMDLTSELSRTLRSLIQPEKNSTRAGDWAETAADIHRLQHRIMAQAAARAHPDRYRGWVNDWRKP